MSIVYDYDGGPRHTYRNKPRWLVQARERQVVTFPIWNRRDGAKTGRRRVASWTPWRTVVRCESEAAGIEMLYRKRGLNPLAQWRLTWGGKVMA